MIIDTHSEEETIDAGSALAARLSAGGAPVTLLWGIRLPAILPHDAGLHGLLWQAHVALAFAFFALILLHIAAGLFHALIRRDGVFESMAGGTARNETAPAE